MIRDFTAFCTSTFKYSNFKASVVVIRVMRLFLHFDVIMNTENFHKSHILISILPTISGRLVHCAIAFLYSIFPAIRLSDVTPLTYLLSPSRTSLVFTVHASTGIFSAMNKSHMF